MPQRLGRKRSPLARKVSGAALHLAARNRVSFNTSHIAIICSVLYRELCHSRLPDSIMKESHPRLQGTLVQNILIGLAIITCLAGVYRIIERPEPGQPKRVDETSLLFFAVSGALLLLRDVKSLSFGDYKLEFADQIKELKARIEDTQAQAFTMSSRPLQHSAIEDVEREFAAITTKASSGFSPVPGEQPDDPWKGAFGGNSSNGTRELMAEVTPVDGSYRIQLQVVSTSPERHPLAGTVQFFLHPTFPNDRPFVTVSPSGVAELNLIAWGAFTVGAVADGGQTPLELDLAMLASAPAQFRER